MDTGNYIYIFIHHNMIVIILPHRITWSWYTGRWWVGCYIWYSKERTWRGRSSPRPLLAVPNVTASVVIAVLLCSGPLLCGFNVPIQGFMASWCWNDRTCSLWRATDIPMSLSLSPVTVSNKPHNLQRFCRIYIIQMIEWRSYTWGHRRSPGDTHVLSVCQYVVSRSPVRDEQLYSPDIW